MDWVAAAIVVVGVGTAVGTAVLPVIPWFEEVDGCDVPVSDKLTGKVA